MGLEPMTSTLRVRRATPCATPPIDWYLGSYSFCDTYRLYFCKLLKWSVDSVSYFNSNLITGILKLENKCVVHAVSLSYKQKESGMKSNIDWILHLK